MHAAIVGGTEKDAQTRTTDRPTQRSLPRLRLMPAAAAERPAERPDGERNDGEGEAEPEPAGAARDDDDPEQVEEDSFRRLEAVHGRVSFLRSVSW